MPATFADVLDAATRIAPFVHHTPVFTSAALDDWLGTSAVLKGEHLQRAGAFKYRGATNAVQSLSDADARNGVAAHSSGNHAAALARAAATRGVPAHVVMPESVRAVKKAAVLAYGASITECENSPESREATLREVITRTGAVEVHPYDNDVVIAGAGTAALELVDAIPNLDVVVAPVGGGGLLSGTALAAHGRRDAIVVMGAEPVAADDAARSLSLGTIQPPLPPTTRADGLLTGLSERTFAVLREHVSEIVTVDEAEIIDAMQVVWQYTKQVIEPSAAVAIAAVHKRALADATVGIIVSGGNVDLEAMFATLR